MEQPNQNDVVEPIQIKSDDSFDDALDDFPLTDSDAGEDQPDHSTSSSTVTFCLQDPSLEVSSPAHTLRRRPISRRVAADPDESPAGSRITGLGDPKARFREKREKICYKLKEENLEDGKRVDSAGLITGSGKVMSALGGEPVSSSLEDGKRVASARVNTPRADSAGLITGNGEVKRETRGAESASALGGEPGSSDWLDFVASLVIKAIGFQFNLFFKFVTFPVWFLYNCYTLIVDPFGVTRRCKVFFVRKFGSLRKWSFGKVSPLLGDYWFKDQKVAWSLLSQCWWGLFWSVYVGLVLCGFLVVSLMLSGFLVRYLVEQPLQMEEDLNFDYTKNSPVAYVPVRACSGVGCGVNCEMKVGDARAWLVPPNYKLRASISLTLPESEYNRNLGIFQVRVEFLSAECKILASKSHPCMLKFKSEPVRVLATFLKAAPLVTGYVSESQTLQFNIRGLAEGRVPTCCVKVTIEQRAEFRPGAGIPEIYGASLRLESELPFFKKVVWFWRKTIFIWTSIVYFLMQLLFTLVCCRGLIIPRTRTGRWSVTHASTRNDVPRRT